MYETLPSTTEEDHILLIRGKDKLYNCLKCDHKLEEYDAMRMPYKRSHGVKVAQKKEDPRGEECHNSMGSIL
ncbi:unnamed protein product, partial [Aphanomyces euteiches]